MKKTIFRKVLAFILSFSVFMSAGVGLPAGIFSIAFAQDSVAAGDFLVSGGTEGVDYSYEDGTLTILTATQLTIKNADVNAVTTDKILVASDVAADVILAGVNIDVSASGCAFNADSGKTVTVTLADGSNNTLRSGAGYAGLWSNDSELIINGGALGTGKLSAQGGGRSAGIGGGFESVNATVTINGGDIKAYGGEWGAGIGSGYYSSNATVTINGGKIWAYGDEKGAGIGSGYYSSDATVTINGGEILAQGGSDSAGIGGGAYCKHDTVVINGGDIEATGGQWGAGIGSGMNSEYTTVEISGGTIFAYGGSEGAGIGSGDSGVNTTVTINGGVIEAQGGSDGAGIGSGLLAQDTTVTINGGSIKAQGGENADGIGSSDGNTTPKNALGEDVTAYTIDNPDSKDIAIDGKVYPSVHSDSDKKVYVYLSMSEHYLAQGSDVYKLSYEENSFVKTEDNNSDNPFIIKGINLEEVVDYYFYDSVLYIDTEKEITISNKIPTQATSCTISVQGRSANIVLAGVNISSDSSDALSLEGYGGETVTITLADGTVNRLVGEGERAGLYTDYCNLVINGGVRGDGQLEVSSGRGRAGIGSYNSWADITINGGIIDVRGGEHGAGIGGGEYISNITVTINGGKIIAEGGAYGAGIGGGDYGSDITVTINGGEITAQGGDYGAGIGSGNGGFDTTVTINGGSVKAQGGSDAIDIGDTNSNTLPVNDNGDTVYLLEIDNPLGEEIIIGDKEYPSSHFDEKKIYAYLPAEETIMSIGSRIYLIEYTDGGFVLAEYTGKDFVVEGDNLTEGVDYEYQYGSLRILTDKKMTIRNLMPSTPTDCSIEVMCNTDNITLAGVNIDGSILGKFGLTTYDNNVIITLADGSVNTIKGGGQCPAVSVSGELTINAQTLGTGKLIAQSSNEGGTGIGNISTSDISITINGGIIEAQGGENGAGIGSGFEGDNTTVEINGGTVTATGGDGYAGIGSGAYCANTTVTINDGIIEAQGGLESAGIGSGYYGSDTTVTINGGIIEAQGGLEGAGIGSGYYGYDTTVTINGGVVTANGSGEGAGIGSGYNGNNTTVTINGGSVKAETSGYADAIGTYEGYTLPVNDNGDTVYLFEIDNPSGEKVIIGDKEYPSAHGNEKKVYAYLPGEDALMAIGKTIYSVTFDENTEEFSYEEYEGYPFIVTGEGVAEDTDYEYNSLNKMLYIITDKKMTIKNVLPAAATDFGIFVEADNGDVVLAGVNIDTLGGNGFALLAEHNLTLTLADGSENRLLAGIRAKNITINAQALGTGKLYAKGDFGYAGIGSGNVESSTYITINGGIIEAQGGGESAGIGSGNGADETHITITGGEITAQGGENGAGIGSGYNGRYTTTITVSGGEITAEGGLNGAGIGSGYGAYETLITITGGEITAQGGENAAGIGSGVDASGTTVTVTGGSIKAQDGAGFTNDAFLNDSGEELAGATIPNPDGVEIKIEGNDYPVKHIDEKVVYPYLTKEDHRFTFGDTLRLLKWNEDTEEFEIALVTPAASDFVITPPASYVYNGAVIAPEVSAAAEALGMGEITVTFKDAQGNETSPVNAGVYTIFVSTAEGAGFEAIDGLALGEFEIIKAQGVIPAHRVIDIVNGAALSTVEPDEHFEFLDAAQIIGVNTQTVEVLYTNLDENYDYSQLPGYDSQRNAVLTTAQVNVINADTKIWPTLMIADPFVGTTEVVWDPEVQNISGTSAVPTQEWKVYYKIDDGEKTLVDGNQFFIPFGTSAGTIITFIFEYAGEEGFNPSTREFVLTIDVCPHERFEETKGTDEQYHWDVCSYCHEKLNISEHTWSTEYSFDENSHWIECTECGVHKDEGEHTGGEALCTIAPICSVCNNSYGEVDPDNHTWESEYDFDENTHWIPCSYCAARKDESEHTGGEADCINQAHCSVCDTDYGEVDSDNHKHINETEFGWDNETHWNYCDDCDMEVNEEPHAVKTPATLESGALCECGKVISNRLGDVNSTGGKADIRDVVLLYQSVSNWEVEIDENAADVNGDTEVSIRDVVMLYQYYSGRNVG